VRSRRTRWGRWFALAVVAALIGGGVAAWLAVHHRPAGNPETVEVTVPRGVTLDRLVGLLEGARLTERPTALRWTLRYKGTLASVKAGVYTFPGDAHALDIARVLEQPPAALTHLTLTLIPGESVWEAGRRMEALGIGAAGELAALAEDRAFARGLGLPVGPERPPRPDGHPQTYLEGFLHPETYFLALDATVESATRRAAEQFKRVWGEVMATYRSDYLAVTGRYGLSELDIITLASLIEEEVVVASEAPRVAGVFYNRLAQGMRLQTDPTLVYRPGDVGRAPTPTDRRDATNPYNTYAIPGLPPGPICSPARGALVAALRPERHDYLYFVARRDGTGAHAFARTFEEHRANIERYLKRAR